MKILIFLLLNKIKFFFSDKLIYKLLIGSKKFFNYLRLLDGFIFIDLKLEERTKNIKIIEKEKLNKIIFKLKNSDFIKLFLFSLIKLLIKILKIIINFLGFIIYAIWSYLNTILLYAIGYILLEFGATRIYDPSQDITSREIWEIISRKLYNLRKKYFSEEYFLIVFDIFWKKYVQKLLLAYSYTYSFLFFVFFKLLKNNKNILFITNIYIYLTSLIILFLINNVLFFKKIFYSKNVKKKLNFFFYKSKTYLSLNYFNFFINFFKKNNFFLNKKFFEKKLLKHKVYVFDFETYLKITTKLKKQMLYAKNIFQFNRFKNYFSYRFLFWSTQKRFLYFYITLLKKSKKIKMGALRVIYIEEWWVFKFYLKNYYFNSFFKVIIIFYNLIKVKIIFMFLYLDFIINLIGF